MYEIIARTERVSRGYGVGAGRVRALEEVTVAFRRKQLTAVMGPSGSGKSTLMHLLAGLDSPDQGRVFLADQELTGLNDDQLTAVRRRHLGFIFQAFNLLPTLDIAGNLRLPFELDDREPVAEEERWIQQLIDRLGLRERLSHRPAQLSGGQQQRVAIGRAMVTRPDLIVADEPTGNLDTRSGTEVMRMLRASVDEFGQSVVLVTHDPAAAAFADRVVFLADGQSRHELAFGGTAQQIAQQMLALEEVAA